MKPDPALPRKSRASSLALPGSLFRTALGKTKTLEGSGRCRARMSGMWCAAVPATPALKPRIGCHTFRATGITDYLTNGGHIEVAQRMAGHLNAKTTGLYDCRNDDISVGEVERIEI